ESDANQVAWYLSLTSGDPFVLYSGLMNCYSEAIRLVRLFPNSESDAIKLKNSLCDGIKTEFSEYSKFWNEFKLLDNMGSFFNDIYLKLSGQQNGVGSYNPPPQISDSGEKDDHGNTVWVIEDFSEAQNMLIQLYFDGYLQKVNI
ncbi:MAG: DUF3810 family protein, partial [Corallococcus sp.]|nr:DUF3810 family protein [Corallococcus sp.]